MANLPLLKPILLSRDYYGCILFFAGRNRRYKSLQDANLLAKPDILNYYTHVLKDGQTQIIQDNQDLRVHELRGIQIWK